MLYIAAYLMIGVLMSLMKAYLHPPSVFFAEIAVEMKKNGQKVPSYVSFCALAFFFCTILWPVSLVDVILAKYNKK